MGAKLCAQSADAECNDCNAMQCNAMQMGVALCITLSTPGSADLDVALYSAPWPSFWTTRRGRPSRFA